MQNGYLVSRLRWFRCTGRAAQGFWSSPAKCLRWFGRCSSGREGVVPGTLNGSGVSGFTAAGRASDCGSELGLIVLQAPATREQFLDEGGGLFA